MRPIMDNWFAADRDNQFGSAEESTMSSASSSQEEQNGNSEKEGNETQGTNVLQSQFLRTPSVSIFGSALPNLDGLLPALPLFHPSLPICPYLYTGIGLGAPVSTFTTSQTIQSIVPTATSMVAFPTPAGITVLPSHYLPWLSCFINDWKVKIKRFTISLFHILLLISQLFYR